MTETRAPSDTALMVAAYRARATLNHPAFCLDPWAAELAGARGAELAEAFDVSMPHMELWIGLRTAYLDHVVAHLLGGERGISQVVILGAGMDTRATRLQREGVRFFEVDTPAAQARKRAALATLEGYTPEVASYVSCDFEHQDFLERLVVSGFDPETPALFLIEGVVYYLTEEAVRGTLSRIAEAVHSQSVVAFDTIPRRVIDRHKIGRSEGAVTLVEELGEPFLFGLDDAVPLLWECGFGFVRTINFDEIALMFEGTYKREREFRFQKIVVASGAALRDTL